METKIVKAEKKYISQIAQIEASEIIVPWSENQLTVLLDNEYSVFNVLIDNKDNVIGYYSYAAIIDEADINNIAIRKDMQSKGFGTKLMQDMLDDIARKNISNITLEVETGNEKAIGLYKKFGFKIEGVRKAYYNNKFDAYIMWKR